MEAKQCDQKVKLPQFATEKADYRDFLMVDVSAVLGYILEENAWYGW